MNILQGCLRFICGTSICACSFVEVRPSFPYLIRAYITLPTQRFRYSPNPCRPDLQPAIIAPDRPIVRNR
ncbi:hypothetical protein HBH98_109820 [Parastagonospora nodorum]|nr:hypothetical protein HBH53_137310 [Parastagonospora nodorum]KAH3985552.1 hypothetical protein HBH51_021480 [Parastagonospora nodorum]KAH4037786.1 hypothetical protein HBI09_058910 [Parastagonospora nodorum]KAH4054090.1 hypothetical protein HBH49_075700 [Parastagonospora nodorum]KAH4174273.1 hypothetical protein HBH43_074100 [Parastagonospora nodorum]